MAKYYVTVHSGETTIVYRKVFASFHEAIECFSGFYTPKSGRCVLEFTTEVVNGKFARAFAELLRPEEISGTDPLSTRRYEIAAKQTNAFSYDRPYFFLVESQHGLDETIDND